jgi:hypothetical protein
VNAIHDDCVVALHVQSRSAATVTVPVPPPDPNDGVGVDTLGWHRAAVVLDGPATLVVAELPHAMVRHATQAAAAITA